MAYWLMKSEPDVFSIDDLRALRRDCWDGVRNYQARNMIRDEMKKGDLAFFYHSNCKEPGIVGIMRICSEAYPDNTVYKGKSNADPDNPTWYMVDVQYRRKLKRNITLQELRAQRALDGFQLLRPGNRLSVMPVSQRHWNHILGLE